ncbi:MAG: FtsW/RodA/SpoVE family cell cycle protein [Bacteroidales bacterium]|nr:FtsW/RodA/SpoVE family cell cycle protein [Bacteroidales bacterium]HKL93548.1 FtsW/RodA/SpoVE family cell cycle protein [Bacteroidales bacterium]
MSLIRQLFRGDGAIWIIFLLLGIISLIEVYSASSTLAYSSGNAYGPIVRHAGFLLLGTIVILVTHSFHYKYVTLIGAFLFVLSFALLVLTPVIGVRVNNAARWISFFGIQFQPSEFAKLAIIIFTAFVLSKTQRSDDSRRKAFWIILTVTLVFAGLIFFENLSTAVLLCTVVFLMMFLGRVNAKNLLFLGGGVVLLVAILFLSLKTIDTIPGLPRWDTWQNRIFGPELKVTDEAFSITDANYQSSHASMAIAEGLFLGKIPGNSSQRDFLPQAYSDFIYAIIIEEMGWFGMILIPLLYIMLLQRALLIARRCTKVYPMLLVMGSSLMISIQAFVNMLVAVGFFPVTGQPLPLVSRGGTSTVITCFYFGIILAVSRFGVQEDEKKDALQDKATERSIEYGI